MADTPLHIVNGDVAGAVLQSSGIAGEVLVWRELYTAGPLNVSAAQRCAWLFEHYGIPAAEFLTGHERQQSQCCTALADGIAALWMDPDLFDQAIFMRVCHIANVEHPNAQLYLVELPYGPLTVEEMPESWQARRLLSGDEIAAAARAWEAYSALSRESLEQWLLDVGPLYPVLSNALKFQLQRFPGEDGSGVVERSVLKILADHEGGFSPTVLFRKVSEQFPLFGMGDLQFWRILETLSHCSPPLIRYGSQQQDSRIQLPLYLDSLAGLDGYKVYITENGHRVATGERTAPIEALEIASFG
jgi:hypothetical protein